ncbi:MAG: adaptor protein MecA [Clostridiales bacterium]|nr:adaptor protein MecA [Lachnospiraceae bacterium]MCD8045664.1 adaptor protein MecA [Clostridiales bacterium]
MKIEKLNEQQIRCTLTKEDLAERHIKLSELAYGTEKTRALFQDMMEQASIDFGFEAEDIPLMVEAIPLSAEKIVLIITKVESPDELDTRFSEFSHFFSDEEPDEEESDTPESSPHIPDELAGLLNQLRQEITNAVAKQAPPAKELPADQVCLFAFTDTEAAIQACQTAAGAYRGESALYRDPRTNEYLLFLHQQPHTAMEFGRIIMTMSAFLEKRRCLPATEAFFREHGRTILTGKAVHMLAKI